MSIPPPCEVAAALRQRRHKLEVLPPRMMYLVQEELERGMLWDVRKRSAGSWL